MGLGPTATIGFQGEDGNWVAVSPDTPFPVHGTDSGGGGWTPPTGTNGQVLKYNASGNVVAATDNDTTYTALSQAEIDAGTATTARTITGQRAQGIVDKARTGLTPALNGVTGLWQGTQAQYDAIGTKTATVVYVIKAA